MGKSALSISAWKGGHMARRKNSSAGNLKVDFTQNFLSQFKLGESYISLFLGLVIVVIAAVLVVTLTKNIKSKNVNTSNQDTLSQKAETLKEELKFSDKKIKTYTVSVNDNLWNISEKVYKSGYKWVDIAKANNLENPGFIHSGNVLKLPEVKPLIASSEVVSKINSISGNTYIIQKGDDLWDIAVRAYGDGFKWENIAKANNLTEPDLIFAGNTLKIPR